MFSGSVQMVSRLNSQSQFQMFTLFSDRLIGGLGSIILRGTLRRISQLWENAHNLNLESCLLYLSSIILQFVDFCCFFFFFFIA